MSDTGKSLLQMLRDDALIDHLAKVTNELVQRSRTWVDRTVRRPGANIRVRLVVRRSEDDED